MTSQVSNTYYSPSAQGYSAPSPYGYQDNTYNQNNQQNYQQQPYQQQPYQQQPYQQPQQSQQHPQQSQQYPQQSQQYPQQSQQYPQQQTAPIYAQPTASFNFGSLASLPSVSIKQQVEQFEAITGYETANQYAVLDPSNNLLMRCSEKSSTFAKLAMGSGRAMEIKITDASGAPIMSIARPFKLWHKDVAITDGSGRPMGSVLKKFAIGKTIFHVMDNKDTTLFTIKGGAFINVGKSRKFTIMNSQGTEVGYIQKEWAGFMKEAFTDADHFTINFPQSASGETRALLIATTLFIDLSHFEK